MTSRPKSTNKTLRFHWKYKYKSFWPRSFWSRVIKINNFDHRNRLTLMLSQRFWPRTVKMTHHFDHGSTLATARSEFVTILITFYILTTATNLNFDHGFVDFGRAAWNVGHASKNFGHACTAEAILYSKEGLDSLK